MKDLKYEHQSTFLLWGRVKLNFKDRYRKPNIILRTPATIKFFHQILKNDTLVWIKNHYPLRWICIAHIWSPTLFPRRIIIFQGVLTKFNFLTKFPHLEKIGESGTREKMAFKDDLCQMCKNNHYLQLVFKYKHIWLNRWHI